MKEYIAIVTNENDPERYKRSQVRVYELFPEHLISEKDLPWATYKLPLGARFNEGAFVTAQKGDYVWVDFPFSDSNGNEDTTRPRITGWVHHCPNSLPNLPHEAFNGPASLEGMHMRPDDEDIEQPEVNMRADAISLWGTVFEFVRNGVFRLTQKTTGTAIEFSRSGHGGFFSQNNLFLTARQKLKLMGSHIEIKAKNVLRFAVNALEFNLNRFVMNVKGLLHIKGTGGTKITGADMSVVATQGNMNLNSAGMLNQSASGANVEKIGIDTLLSTDEAKVIEVNLNGMVLAKISISTTGAITFEEPMTGGKIGLEDTGLILAENSAGSIKKSLEELISKLEEFIDASKDVVIDTGNGPGKVNASSVSNYIQIKTGLTQVKTNLAMVLK
ncbi:MAG: hypothetical protein MJE63_32925 [Proteobacteria bacterium]|nr:hypothetical protein [Pseudomonadota bacterium]